MAPGCLRSREAVLAATALALALLTTDAIQGGALNRERSCAPAMALFRDLAGGLPIATLDAKPTVLYYLDRSDVALLAGPTGALEFLQAHPRGIVITERDGDDDSSRHCERSRSSPWRDLLRGAVASFSWDEDLDP